jgi:flagella basal body P-ring formation protein FlgA
LIVCFSRIFILITILIFHSNFALAISGKEISKKVSDWLTINGVSGSPVFSDNRVYNDCDQKLKISKYLNSFKIIRVKCPNDDDIDLFVRIKLDQKIKAKSKKPSSHNKNKLTSNSKLIKKEKKIIKNYKVFKLSRGIEKNSVLQEEDIKVIFSDISSQSSFFKNKNDLIGRKLNKNLKMDQILHPRHLIEKFDVNNGDQVSIVSNTKSVSVVTLGEALNSGNLDDLIRVKNVRSGKVIKGYIKKNKIIRVFR